MARNQMVVVLVVAITIFPMVALATEHIVGGDYGWSLGVDYEAWAYGNEFRVGDTLVFNYSAGAHNVIKVNGTAFQSCTKSPNLGKLNSGYDTVTLATSGNKWYICGVGKHCESGMKLKITVLPEWGSLAPAPAPWSWTTLLPKLGSPSPAATPPSAETPIYY